MKRFVGVVGALLIAFLLLAPAVLAASALPRTGRVLVSTGGDVTIPAGEHADAVVVVKGTATIAGEVNAIVVVDGAAVLTGARTETIVAVRSPVELGPETVVLGDVMTVDSPVHQTGNAQIRGEVTDMATLLIGVGAVLAPALLLMWVGFSLATVVAGLLLAGLAARQVRDAEGVISREPILAVAAGLVGLIVFPAVAFLLMATLIGAPLGLGILLGAWPLVAFIGYLVAGIWIGEWVLRRTSPDRVRERPYLAAVIGVLLLEVLALVPIVTIVVMIASLFGFGSMLVLMARKLGSPSVSQPKLAGPMSAPIGIGSAVYAGHWLKEASGFVRDHEVALSARPVWLFSSGPVGRTATSVAPVRPAEVKELSSATDALDHRVFAGALDRDAVDGSELGFADRFIAKRFVPEGDFRDWPAIDAWADEIARELTASPIAGR